MRRRVQSSAFHDKVSLKLDIIEGTLEEHAQEKSKQAEAAEQAAGALQGLKAKVAEHNAAHVTRLANAEANIGQAVAGAVLEGMLHSLEAEEGAKLLRQVESRLEEQTRSLESKVHNQDDIVSTLSTQALETDDQVVEVRTRVTKVEQELEALLQGAVSPTTLERGGESFSSFGSNEEDALKSTKELAREERAALGGGDMDTIDEDAEEDRSLSGTQGEEGSNVPGTSEEAPAAESGTGGEESAQSGGTGNEGEEGGGTGKEGEGDGVQGGGEGDRGAEGEGGEDEAATEGKSE